MKLSNKIPLRIENPEWLKNNWKATCQDEACGWRGPVHDLLVEPDNSTMYCPQCGTANWVYD